MPKFIFDYIWLVIMFAIPIYFIYQYGFIGYLKEINKNREQRIQFVREIITV
jgi:hypothetical protein